jgi:hypothetical protein
MRHLPPGDAEVGDLGRCKVAVKPGQVESGIDLGKAPDHHGSRIVERCFLHAPDSHLLATEPPEFSLEN